MYALMNVGSAITLADTVLMCSRKTLKIARGVMPDWIATKQN